MELSAGIKSSLAGRYASALFDLASEAGTVSAAEADLDRLETALGESAELRALIRNPEITREQIRRVMAGLAEFLELSPLTRNFLGVLAENRRVSALPGMIRAFQTIAAAQRGEVGAEVVSAHALSDDQLTLLEQKLRAREGAHREAQVACRSRPARRARRNHRIQAHRRFDPHPPQLARSCDEGLRDARGTAVDDQAQVKTCYFLLSLKSSGSSIVQANLAKSINARVLEKTTHFENETLYFVKAGSVLGTAAVPHGEQPDTPFAPRRPAPAARDDGREHSGLERRSRERTGSVRRLDATRSRR